MKNDFLDKGRISQKLETRDKILVAAQHLLREGKNFTLEDVAKKAAVSRATIYRYYSNVDILSGEAGLAINVRKPEAILKGLEGLDLRGVLLGVQEYYNDLALDYENAFRKYLAITLTNTARQKRGARRIKTLQLALKHTKISSEEKRNLENLCTVLMGIEPLVVSKDVCGLTDEQSKELLQWGMERVLKAVLSDKDQ